MLVVVCPDPGEVSRQAAELVAAAVSSRPGLTLGLAAGATPVGLYRLLVRRRGEGLSFAGVTVFGLDEYLGLPPGHPACFRNVVRGDLLDHLDLAPAAIHWPESRPQGGVMEHCAAYERTIAGAGGIDLQILGIGGNGHVGFNEPGSSLGGRTRPVHLSQATRRANAGSFAAGEEVPEAAITMGLGTIREARRIILLATGEGKAAAIAGAVEGPVTAMLPASVLQLHPDVTVFADTAAAGRLTRGEEYAAEAALLRRQGMLG